MKKSILIVFALIMLTVKMVSAQTFSLTSDGFVNSDDETKNYVVIELPGEQQKLYNQVRSYLMGVYASPKDVLSEASPEMITINGIERDAVQKKAMGMVATSYEMNYTIPIRFKDGKIRIDAPSFTLVDYNTGSKPIKMILCGKSNGGFGSEVINAIYDKKGKLKAKYAKEQLERYFNDYIQSLVKGLSSNETDNW